VQSYKKKVRTEKRLKENMGVNKVYLSKKVGT
jgi:hypothetical protein